MTGTLAGALATAGLLGVTHAVEPDHVAGISAVTSECGDSRLSALVGACFSLGHVALVVVWLVGGYLLLGRTAFPAALDAVGTAGVALLLGLLGGVMAVRGLGTVLHSHDHGHDDGTHAHPHLHLPRVGGADHAHGEPVHPDAEHAPDEDTHAHAEHAHGEDIHAHDDPHAHDDHAHDHGVVAHLKTGLVGALFTLSPPVSMILFASTVVPAHGVGAVALAVLAYAVGIVATMSAIGAGAGTLFGVVEDPRTRGALRGVAGVAIVALGAAVALDALPALG